MRTAGRAVVAALVVGAWLTTGCSFAVRGPDPASGTGGVGADTDDPKLESPQQPGAPPTAIPDMAVTATADLSRPPPDLAKAPAPPSTVGQPCTKDDNCGNGLVCVKHVGGVGIFGTDFPGGYCSQGCSNDAACPAGSLCR